ncbi:MAG: DEAD/DEAH box helicase, partial [Endozoicomonas sp.]
HAEYVAKEFRKAGYNAEFVHGDMDDEDRVKVLNGLGNGTIHVVASCDLISEGTDIPAIFCAILLRPTQSTGLYIQQVGRALRILEGKNGAIILDHVGNVITHGIPEEHREWSLDGEKKKRRRKGDGGLVRALQCPSCFAVHEPLPACPYCGHVHQKKEEEMPTETDGVLEEVTAEAAEEISRKRKMQQHKEVTNAKSLAELEDIARQRGYKPGWAKYVFKSKQAKLQQMAERHGK